MKHKLLAVMAFLLLTSFTSTATTMQEDLPEICKAFGITESTAIMEIQRNYYMRKHILSPNADINAIPEDILPKLDKEALDILKRKTYKFEIREKLFSDEKFLRVQSRGEWVTKPFERKAVCRVYMAKMWAQNFREQLASIMQENIVKKELATKLATKEMMALRIKRGTANREMVDLGVGKTKNITLFSRPVLKLCKDKGFYLNSENLKSIQYSQYTLKYTKVDYDLYEAFKRKEYENNMAVLHDICYAYADSKKSYGNIANVDFASEVLSVPDAHKAVKKFRKDKATEKLKKKKAEAQKIRTALAIKNKRDNAIASIDSEYLPKIKSSEELLEQIKLDTQQARRALQQGAPILDSIEITGRHKKHRDLLIARLNGVSHIFIRDKEINRLGYITAELKKTSSFMSYIDKNGFDRKVYIYAFDNTKTKAWAKRKKTKHYKDMKVNYKDLKNHQDETEKRLKELRKEYLGLRRKADSENL